MKRQKWNKIKQTNGKKRFSLKVVLTCKAVSFRSRLRRSIPRDAIYEDREFQKCILMRLNILKVSILILVSSITFFSVILFQAVSISFVVNLNLVHLVTFFVILCPSLAYSDRGMYAINYPFYSFTNATIEIIILLSSFVIILNHLIHDLFLILLISSGQFSTS